MITHSYTISRTLHKLFGQIRMRLFGGELVLPFLLLLCRTLSAQPSPVIHFNWDRVISWFMECITTSII